VLVDDAAPLAQVSAGSIYAPLEHQFAVVVPFRQEVGKAAPIALFVDRDACIIGAGRAAGARDRASLAAPPGRQEVLRCVVHASLCLVHCSLPPMRARSVAARAHPTRPQPLLNPSLTPTGRKCSPGASDAELRL